MKKFITLADFGTELLKVMYGHGTKRLMSIGTTSDGNYTFRCVDDAGKEKVLRVPCWEDGSTVLLDRVTVLEHAIQYGNAAAVEMLKSYGPDNYVQTKQNYDDLLYLLSGGKEGTPMEDF